MLRTTILMNSWNCPCDYRLTVSRAKRFSRRKPVKSRHPITNACCRKMTGERGKFVARSSREEKTLDDVENNFSKVTRPSALFNFFLADSASFSYFYLPSRSIHPLSVACPSYSSLSKPTANRGSGI